MRSLSSAMFLLLCPEPAFAQTPQPAPQTSDVVRAADDAFGRRIGVEEVGLYSESEVRGFSLQSAGNYRIEDHYYVRATSPTEVIVEGTAVRVGVNGLRTDFAAPSGLLQYDLPSAAPGVAASVEGGWWEGSGPTLVARFQAADREARLGIAGGVQLNPAQRYADGSSADYFAVGIIPRWRPAPGITISGILSRTWFTFEPDTFFASETRVPDRLRRGRYRGQDWMRGKTVGTLAGFMADVEAGGWRLGASGFLSEADSPRGYFNLLTLSADGGAAENAVVAFPDERSRSLSGEAFAARSFATGRVTHRLVAMIRARDSIARINPGATALLGTFADIDAPPTFAEPEFDFEEGRGQDKAQQWSAGLGYRLSVGDRIEFRVDAQQVRYRRQVAEPDGPVERGRSSPWLYSGALAAGLSPRLTLFASYARGLEDSGVAPGNAINRGEVLPATLARQAELGLRYRFEQGPSLIAGLFDIAKPLPGLRANGIYDFVGRVRHRGIELSLAGRLTERLSAVFGATIFKASVTGDLVERGVVGPEPVGRSERVILGNVAWEVPWRAGLAVDGGFSLRGGREANALNSLSVPGYTTIGAGLRQRVTVDGRLFALRARVSNLLNSFAWDVTSSGLYIAVAPRAFTFTITGEI